MTVNIGFIGTGGIAQTHLHNLARINDADVIAFCDIECARAQKEAQRWPNAKAYTDIDDMLDDRKLDAVYICVPPMAHGEAERAVIARGIPFLVEKPLGIEVQGPMEILKKIKEKGLMTAVGYHWRYREGVQKVRAMLKERKIGMGLGYWMGGMPPVPWWRKQDGSGGQFVEQTTHIVDLLRYLCGEVKEVYAGYSQRVLHEKVAGTTVADVGTVTLTLESGIVANIANTCLLPVEYRVGLDIYTDLGVLEIHHASIKDIQSGVTSEYKESKNPFFVEDESFVHAVRTGDSSKILSNYEDAIQTHRVTVAANTSAETGQVISLKERAEI